MNNVKYTLLIPIFTFLLITLPFINTLPYLDGNIDFIQASDFLYGGINNYFNNWNTVHPPLKLIIIYPFFLIFGPSEIIYNFYGIFFGVIGIISIFLLTKKISNERTALLASFLLSTNALFISNSIFLMRDFMLTVLILLSLYLYSEKKYILYAFAASLSVLTKETALLLPSIILTIELIIYFVKKCKLNKNIIIKFISLLIPFVVYSFWKYYLSFNGKNSWSEWIFTNNENKSAIYTIINNLITLNFLNPYAQAHLKQLLFLNFNWIYIIIILVTFTILIFKQKSKIIFKINNYETKLIIILFTLSYSLTVLTLQTYTIPRYALPIIPLIIIGVSISINSIKNIVLYRIISISVVLLTLISLFYSVDPVAKYFWGTNQIFNYKVYSLNEHMAGNDGITYNLQYLLIAKYRSGLIQNFQNSNKFDNGYCMWIFPDPNNEEKMLKILNINKNINCK